jgi:hypothetical protein
LGFEITAGTITRGITGTTVIAGAIYCSARDFYLRQGWNRAKAPLHATLLLISIGSLNRRDRRY